MGKKEKLLKIQKEMHELQLLMLKFDDLKTKRDKLFLNILQKLGKVGKTDLKKQLEKDRNDFYEKGLFWTTETSIKWLEMWFERITEKVK